METSNQPDLTSMGKPARRKPRPALLDLGSSAARPTGARPPRKPSTVPTAARKRRVPGSGCQHRLHIITCHRLWISQAIQVADLSASHMYNDLQRQEETPNAFTIA